MPDSRPRAKGSNGRLDTPPAQPPGTNHHSSAEDTDPMPDNDELLTPAEVAELFRVNPRTVTRWARSGQMAAIRTLGGHRRFRKSEILAQLADIAEQ